MVMVNGKSSFFLCLTLFIHEGKCMMKNLIQLIMLILRCLRVT